MKLREQIQSEIESKEQPIKEIRMNPELVYELMKEPIVVFHADDKSHSIFGLPLIRDPRVDTWEIIMLEDTHGKNKGTEDVT